MTIRTHQGYAHVQDLKAAIGDAWPEFCQRNAGAGYVAADPKLTDFNVPCCLVYNWFGTRCSWDQERQSIIVE